MKRIMRFFKRFLIPDDFEISYPETYLGELKRQSNKIVFPASLIAFFDWMGYIPIDMALLPDKPIIVFFRVGLSVISFIILLLLIPKKTREYGMSFLIFLGFYLLWATAILTGLAVSEPVYFGGYLFVLMLPLLGPLPLKISMSMIWSSALIFIIVATANGMEYTSLHARYRLNDLIGVLIVSSLFTYFLDKIRYRSWLKSKKIESQGKELTDDKKRIDELLLNILPEPVVIELKETGSVKPVFYNSATVVFTDFVGFTSIAEKLTPEKLIFELDQCFSSFDKIMDKYDMEKLKTIGDSYMYAGGVPRNSSTAHIDAILAAFEILQYMDGLNSRKICVGDEYWQIRIGINTGSLMAGIVGEKKFVYDVWGDSVNIASRMETHGEVQKINISEKTNEIIQDFFITEYRGKVTAKNKGPLDMFFVVGIRPELSINGEGLCPNEDFCDKYESLKMLNNLP